MIAQVSEKGGFHVHTHSDGRSPGGSRGRRDAGDFGEFGFGLHAVLALARTADGVVTNRPRLVSSRLGRRLGLAPPLGLGRGPRLLLASRLLGQPLGLYALRYAVQLGGCSPGSVSPSRAYRLRPQPCILAISASEISKLAVTF